MRITIILVLLLNVSCAGVQKAKKIRSYITSDQRQVQLGDENRAVKIHYTGCGGFLIENEGAFVMIDPYFSNASPLFSLPFEKLKPDTALIDRFFTKTFGETVDRAGKIKAILLSHSHYDHLADVPTVYRRNCNPDSVQIIGGQTSRHILAGAGIESLSPPFAGQERSPAPGPSPARLYTKNGRTVITPVPSEHAPHICGIKLICCRKEREDLRRFPKKPTQLPEGENFNYLIDFLDEHGRIAFRIFSNAGAACNANEGFPSKAALEEKQVDVLLLCVASFNQVDGYPQELIRFVNPRHIILNHWENFFRPVRSLQEKPATVPGTNVKKFLANLESSATPPPAFTLPALWTEIVISY